MAFLEKKKLVHRDLAARNVLIADDNTAKVRCWTVVVFLSYNVLSHGRNSLKFR